MENIRFISHISLAYSNNALLVNHYLCSDQQRYVLLVLHSYLLSFSGYHICCHLACNHICCHLADTNTIIIYDSS